MKPAVPPGPARASLLFTAFFLQRLAVRHARFYDMVSSDPIQLNMDHSSYRVTKSPPCRCSIFTRSVTCRELLLKGVYFSTVQAPYVSTEILGPESQRFALWFFYLGLSLALHVTFYHHWYLISQDLLGHTAQVEELLKTQPTCYRSLSSSESHSRLAASHVTYYMGQNSTPRWRLFFSRVWRGFLGFVLPFLWWEI